MANKLSASLSVYYTPSHRADVGVKLQDSKEYKGSKLADASIGC